MHRVTCLVVQVPILVVSFVANEPRLMGFNR